MRIEHTATLKEDGQKLYNLLKGPMGLSSRLITRLKQTQGISINGSPARTVDIVHEGDIICASLPEAEDNHILAENIPLSILFEDDALIAVNKPPLMAVHPTSGHQSGTLANGLHGYFSGKGLSLKIRPVNRLDRDTTGVILFAKNPYVQEQLIRQMKENLVEKVYAGVVHGAFDLPSGTINLPIARKPGSLMERIIDPSGDPSITHYETLQKGEELSLVRFWLETGRTHQIRVHCRAMGHPLIGDWLYSDRPTDKISRQALHACRLSFIHPLLKERLTINAPLPEDMAALLLQHIGADGLKML